MNTSGCLFIASEYVFQASGCFFQHPDTPCYISFMFRDFSENLCFFSIDSLYSINNRCLELLVLNSKHYIKIEVVLFWVFVSVRRCSWFSSCKHPDTLFQYSDSLKVYPDAFFNIRIPSASAAYPAYPNAPLGHSNMFFSIRIPSLGIRIPSALAAQDLYPAYSNAFFGHPNTTF